jgi:hypothetical protein
MSNLSSFYYLILFNKHILYAKNSIYYMASLAAYVYKMDKEKVGKKVEK